MKKLNNISIEHNEDYKINSNANNNNERKNYLKNLLINSFFIFSSFSFILITIWSEDEIKVNYMMTYISVGIMALIYAAYNGNLIREFYNRRLSNKVLSIISSLSISIFYVERLVLRIPNKIFDFKISEDYKIIICEILIFLAIPFCIEMFSKIYNYLYDVLKRVWNNSKKINIIFIAITVFILFILILFAFFKVKVLYSSSKRIWDVIYTSDNILLIKGNAWLNINHGENDIRQPLFALFAMPFVAPLYFIEVIFKTNIPISIIFSNIILIVVSAYLLSDMVEEESKKISFIIFYLCTYGPILFMFVLEQYSVAVFWMVLFIYMYINKIENRKLAMIGATGSLITTGIMFPMLFNKEDKFNIRIKKIFIALFLGLFLFFLFGKINMLLALKEKVDFLMHFTGKKIVFIDRFKQYTHFIYNALASINAIGVKGLWRTINVDNFCFEGILILVLLIISFIINRKDKLCKISFLWLIVSFLLLCVLGWGTIENGLVLYSLYFSWAFIVLLYNLFKKIFKELKQEKIFYFFINMLSIILLLFNGYNMLRMLTYLSNI